MNAAIPHSPASTHPRVIPTSVPSPPVVDHANLVEIHLPSALWLAKLTRADSAELLLQDSDGGLPSHWLPTPLATNRDFGGVLSPTDVGEGIEPNLCPVGSLPVPGDRIILARTGSRVEIFGAVVITGLTVTASGGIRLGHRPLVSFDQPVDLRTGRRTNRLLDMHWDSLFGRGGRDRRLLPLSNAEVALSFSAFGLTLETLFSSPSDHPDPAPVQITEAAPIWSLDQAIERVEITSRLSPDRIANGIAAYHALNEVFSSTAFKTVDLTGHELRRDVLLSMSDQDRTSFVIASALRSGESYRVSPHYRDLVTAGAADTILVAEAAQDWSVFHLDANECLELQRIERERVDRRN